MWTHGIGYDQLGYLNSDGQLAAWKIDEHLLCKRFYDEARKDKKR